MGCAGLLAFIGMAFLVALGIGGLTFVLYLVLAVFFFVVAAGVAALSSFSEQVGPLAIGAMIVAFMFYFVAIFLVLTPSRPPCCPLAHRPGDGGRRAPGPEEAP